MDLPLRGHAAGDDQLSSPQRLARCADELERLGFRRAIREEIDPTAPESGCGGAMMRDERARSFEPCWMSHRLTGKRKIVREIAENAPCLVEICAAENAIYAECTPGFQRLGN